MSADVIKHDGVNVSRRAKQSSEPGINNLSGVYVGEVVDNKDSLYTGRISCHISDFGNDSTPRICLLCIPYGGHTEIKASGDDETSDVQSVVSYGMWPQPPEIGTNVLIAFTGSIEQGIVIGSLVSKDRNAMMGGRASGQVYGPDGQAGLGPAVEKNPYDVNDSDTKPSDSDAQFVLERQGLLLDYVRGHSSSSARRESPSRVFGITTREGHVLSMDDGDSEGKNNNIRIRTKTGAQILIDDSKEIIFITNHSGDAWIEMNRAGMIDVYSAGGVNIATDGDYNVHAKGSINMQAEMGVNIKSTGAQGVKLETTVGSIDVYSALDINIQTATNYNLLIAGNSIHKATRIDMNGPIPQSAEKAPIQNQTSNTSVTQSIASRVPEHHPWLGAEIQEGFKVGKGNTA